MSDRSPGHPVANWSEPIGADALIAGLPSLLEQVLPIVLPGQRWYGEKARSLRQIRTSRIAVNPVGDDWLALFVADLLFADDDAPVRYFLPLLISAGEQAGREFCRIRDGHQREWSVCDGPTTPAFQRWVIRSAANSSASVDSANFPWFSTGTDQLVQAVGAPARLSGGEQSNSNIAYGDQVIIKIFRRVESGLNPDVELGRFLTGQAHFAHVPVLLADWTLRSSDGTEASIGLAQTLVPNIGDGWSWLLDQMRAARTTPALIADIGAAIGLLGQRTAELHLALASGTGSGMAPTAISAEQTDRWRQTALDSLATTDRLLATLDQSHLDERTRLLIRRFADARPLLEEELGYFRELSTLLQTRVHGDYHLGQTLRRQDHDWTILDFEGEPARSLAERRARQSPLKDVAGMLRSLAYARAFAAQPDNPGWTDPGRVLDEVFLSAYRSTIAAADAPSPIIPVDDATFSRALRPWVIEKAIYEIAYERNNRPDWLWAPLAALFSEDLR